MDEVVSVLQDILYELQSISRKIDDIRGSGAYSMDDVCNTIEGVRGTGVYDTISDLADKLDSIETNTFNLTL